MKLVIFGLSVSSSWGNSHATLWRGLIRAIAARGHRVVFFEREVEALAAHRDLSRERASAFDLVLYPNWTDVRERVRSELLDADAAIVTSYCPDGVAATDVVSSSRVPRRVFYDLDTPITLARVRAGDDVPYLSHHGLKPFDLVLSITGGAALEELRTRLGARLVAPLYGCVDEEAFAPVPPADRFVASLSHLGSYSPDRKEMLERLFLTPARLLPESTFVLGGSLYPSDFMWADNIRYLPSLAPADHASFYCSSRITLNVTRGPMRQIGYCPPTRLFEAAACGVPVLTDSWAGLRRFFTPQKEILVADTTEAAIELLGLPRGELDTIASRARERTLDQHRAECRAEEFLDLLYAADHRILDFDLHPSPDSEAKVARLI
jgi:spore maturation protein CgeB